MNEYDEKIDLILKSNQLIVRNLKYIYADDDEKADIIDKQITDIFSPKEKKTIVDLTKDALGEQDE